MLGVVHHLVDKDGQETREDRSAIIDLRAICAAVPSSTAVDELIAQDIEAIKDDRENRWSVVF